MKFCLNSKNMDSATAFVCIKGLSVQLAHLGHQVDVNIWDDYANYDVVIFTAEDSDIDAVRRRNPSAVIGIADPKPHTLDAASRADFCIVSSIEQREAFS